MYEEKMFPLPRATEEENATTTYKCPHMKVKLESNGNIISAKEEKINRVNGMNMLQKFSDIRLLFELLLLNCKDSSSVYFW